MIDIIMGAALGATFVIFLAARSLISERGDSSSEIVLPITLIVSMFWILIIAHILLRY